MNNIFLLYLALASGSPNIGIHAYTLLPGEQYMLRSTITDGILSNSVEKEFVTNLPPYGGTCTVSPGRGNYLGAIGFNKPEYVLLK